MNEPPLQQLKQQLAAHGLSPRKIFGQNFMIDSNFAAAIARDAVSFSPPCQGGVGGVEDRVERTLIVEVGPGTGCLTRALLAHPAARVLAVEIDRGLAALLRETFADELQSGRMTLLEGDVLKSKHELSPRMVEAALEISAREDRPRRVLCANLPYNIATPLLANLAVDREGLGIASAVATLQLELAQRLFARPGEDEYGALSVLMALRAQGRISRRVGNEVFWPRPGVQSAVVEMRFKQWGGVDAENLLRREEAREFQLFLQKLFSQRRKTVRAALKPLVLSAGLGISPTERAENLPPESLLALFRAL